MDKGLKAVLALLFLISGTGSLMGCNPIQRDSNPMQGYTHLYANARPYALNFQKIKLPPAPPAPIDNTEVCLEPFQVSIANDLGNHLVSFTEDGKRTISITVRNLIDPKAEWSTQILPARILTGADLRQVSKDDNASTWQLTWQAPEGSSSSTELKILTVKFFSAALEKKCFFKEAPAQEIRLIVKKSDQQPSISFRGLPSSTISYVPGVRFQIRLDDPKATSKSAPDLTSLTYDPSLLSLNHQTLDASKAVDCGDKGVEENGHWIFNCNLDLSKVPGINDLAHKNMTADIGFVALATSKGSGQTSSPTPASITVYFGKDLKKKDQGASK